MVSEAIFSVYQRILSRVLILEDGLHFDENYPEIVEEVFYNFRIEEMF